MFVIMMLHSTNGKLHHAERSVERGRGERGYARDILPLGEQAHQRENEHLTCKQAIAAVLCPGPGSDHLAYAIYMQVRRKWRKLYESQPPSFANEPSIVPGSPSKRMRTLHRDIAIPAARNFVMWAMNEITRIQRAQQELMQAADPSSASSSVIAEVASMPEADVSDNESDA